MINFQLPETLDYALVAKATSALIAIRLVRGIYQRASLYYSVKHIPGPSYTGFVNGNFQENLDDERAIVPVQWLEKYGKVFRTWGLLGETSIQMADLKGLSHVLKHDADIYQKPDQLIYLMGRLTGRAKSRGGFNSCWITRIKYKLGAQNPAFGPAEIRGLTDVFLEKSIELRDLLSSQVMDAGGSSAKLDVLPWISKMTLDVIGQAGFNYSLQALSGEHNELTSVFSHLFADGNFLTPTVVLKLMFPWLRLLPEADGAVRRGLAKCRDVSRELYERNKAAVEKTGTTEERDLFSLLIKSNMSDEVPEKQRMPMDEVLAQVPTFLGAGHETTSTTTTLALYLLCAAPEIQSKLRKELLSVPTDSPSMDQLNALPYLDAVVRETLRVLAPVQNTIREAMKDDVIPLSQPFVDRYGREHHSVEVKRGQTIIVPILAINKDKTLWGEDAEEFKPERWENLPEAVTAIPGVWGNMMTFLGGPHACIGWRFSIVETKALIFTLLRGFEFELDVPKEDILIKRGFAVHRPVVRGKEGNQLPVIIKPVVM
ncbi:hypothetical protein V5O48_004862 [Marasmius crinis-equi]|uniref:Cytochrome P450 n=1 Tax=Marasmius crinis-equi TaxID=585013 RepID=A0ABR3FNV0_9AGAR